ncbi:hypothetical protein [Paraburkholderia sp. J7]|uniref:hypothetical protein n=1 Tax=Paraburkholderia sp. J7 TaxID=2805438 RepID=UPI002AB6CFD1|nr:hypothetical protein [Paraburkholderia sp. J7]
MSQDNSQNFPVPSPDNAPAGPTGTQRQLAAEESALISRSSREWFYLEVTYTDGGKTAKGYLSQYTGGAMYWDSYVIITDTPQTKFRSVESGAWESDASQVTYKNPPFYLCVTAGPRYWVYLSNYYIDVKWWLAEGKLYNSYAGGPAGCVPQDPPFYSRQLWACFNSDNPLVDCKAIPA